MPVGRPTAYNKKLLEKARKYLTDYQFNGDVVPTVEGLSEYLNVARSALYRYADDEDKKEFKDTLEEIKSLQKKKLINLGLTGEFNSTITKLILSSNHDMAEKQSTDITTGGKSLNEWHIHPVTTASSPDGDS